MFMIRYLDTRECKPLIKEFFDLAHKKFKGVLSYIPDERTIRRWYSPHSLLSAAYDTQTREVVSLCTWTVTDIGFRDKLVAGEIEENDLYVYNETSPAVLLFNTFIVTNAQHAPYIVRHIIKDLHALIEVDHLNILGGMSIGGLRFTEKWLKKLGFHEIGRYKDQYPILWANREDSAVLNSLCNPPGSGD